MARSTTRGTSNVRRKLVWAQTSLTDTAFAVATNRTTDLLAGFIAAGGSTQGCTIMRVHARYTFVTIQGSAFGSRLQQGWAVDTAGADPATVPYNDWMLNKRHYAGDNYASSFLAVTPHAGEIDIRSKRKCDEVGQSLYHSMKWVLGPAATETTASYNAEFRVLLALP